MKSAASSPTDRPTGVVLACAIGVTILFIGRFEAGVGQPQVFAFGLIPGLIAAGTYWRGYRVLGLIPVGLSLLAMSVVCGGRNGAAGVVAAGGLGAGLWAAATLRYLFRGPGRNPQVRIPIPFADAVVLVGLAAVGLAAGLLRQESVWLAVGWMVLVAYAWVRLFREFFELCLEPPYWLSYRVRGCGPGLDAIPYHGPILIVANHAAWWDPVFLAKPMHRPITPMMTSKFFDIWFLRPLVKYAFDVIRVPDTTFRRDAPEIAEAVEALNNGACVVIFPEGFLRRKEEVPLRRFGRGVWEILRQRPDTPVVACWIEGNWGAWPSHFNGPPTKNKPHDFRRPIDVAFSAPITLPPETLADHFATRFALMNAVAAARSHLNLPPLPTFALPETDDEAKQPA